jgi:serine/threonine protein kinase
VPLLPSRAAYILDQLVSVTRDCLHAGRVCHRDLKGENVLVDVNTGEILVLGESPISDAYQFLSLTVSDLGLATHFSMSEAKLTTCCGSPAFHVRHLPLVASHRCAEID